jgi:hypothetical protein
VLDGLALARAHACHRRREPAHEVMLHLLMKCATLKKKLCSETQHDRGLCRYSRRGREQFAMAKFATVAQNWQGVRDRPSTVLSSWLTALGTNSPCGSLAWPGSFRV